MLCTLFSAPHLAAIPFSPPLLGYIPCNDILWVSCRFYVILKISYCSWHRFLLCSCVNNLLSKAFRISGKHHREECWSVNGSTWYIVSPWEIFRVRIYVINHRTAGTSGELLFSCLMLKYILVESRHFLMELRVV